MSYSFSKDIDYSKRIPSGEYEVQIAYAKIKPIQYTNAEGERIESDVLNIALKIRDDWNENKKEAMGKTLFDSAFRRGEEFDKRTIGQIVNAIPREQNEIQFDNENELVAYLKGACVRITLKYQVNKKGNQVSVITYEPSHIKAIETNNVVPDDLPNVVPDDLPNVVPDDLPF